MQLVECVPNFSEGQNLELINLIVSEVAKCNVNILDVDSGWDANRTVLTFIGEAKHVKAAALSLLRACIKYIDMNKHTGSHACFGALDVCPFIPWKNISLEECILLSEDFAKEAAKENIAVYLYADSAKSAERKKLHHLRKGGIYNIAARIKTQELLPDYGLNIHPTAGALATGARNLMLAYNICIESNNLEDVRLLAELLRESGTSDKNSKYKQHELKLSGVEAIGWWQEKYNCFQISTNLRKLDLCNAVTLFHNINKLCKLLNCRIMGSELIGLIPECALLDQNNPNIPMIDIIKELKLDYLKPFDMDRKILERRISQVL